MRNDRVSHSKERKRLEARVVALGGSLDTADTESRPVWVALQNLREFLKLRVPSEASLRTPHTNEDDDGLLPSDMGPDHWLNSHTHDIDVADNETNTTLQEYQRGPTPVNKLVTIAYKMNARYVSTCFAFLLYVEYS
jgi:hypothetical protein